VLTIAHVRVGGAAVAVHGAKLISAAQTSAATTEILRSICSSSLAGEQSPLGHRL
jgi:hypothetical protein